MVWWNAVSNTRRHQFGYCFDTRHVDRIVQRRYIVTFLYFFDDFVCDEHAFVEFFSTVHDPMTNSIDFIERLDTPIFFTGEYIQYVLNSRMVFRFLKLLFLRWAKLVSRKNLPILFFLLLLVPIRTWSRCRIICILPTSYRNLILIFS